MNFGKWIVVAFVLFALFIGTLVTVCVKQDVNLVSKEYYKEELAYQEQIERISNTSHLANKPHIRQVDGKLQVSFNDDVKIQKGTLNLFCPSNPEMDKDFNISLREGNSQLFEINTTEAKMYKAQLRWSMNGKEYFMEEIIYI